MRLTKTTCNSGSRCPNHCFNSLQLRGDGPGDPSYGCVETGRETHPTDTSLCISNRQLLGLTQLRSCNCLFSVKATGY